MRTDVEDSIITKSTNQPCPPLKIARLFENVFNPQELKPCTCTMVFDINSQAIKHCE